MKSRAHKSFSATGRVKFWRSDEGWGVIESADLPSDVWVSFSAIDLPGYRSLSDGADVELRYRAVEQDGWHYVATWVRPTDLA